MQRIVNLGIVAEDNMNVQLQEITVTARDGRVSQLDQVYIRGSSVRFFIVPDMLKNAPMFKQVGPGALKGRGIGLGRGRATVARAQGNIKHWLLHAGLPNSLLLTHVSI